MEWLSRSKDVIAVVVAVIAVALSLVTVLSQRRQQQRHAFAQIHELLMNPEHQRGRWLMWEIATAGRLPPAGSPDYYLINRALGVLNLLAMYAMNGVVPRRWVLEVWHHPIQQMADAVTLLVDDRVAAANWRPWPQLDWLIRQAVDYRSGAGCCLPPRPPAAPTV